MNQANNQCTACDTACVTCQDGTKNYCGSCKNVSTTNYYLIKGTTICSTTCPLGQYIDASFPNACQACSSNCVGCSVKADNCTTANGCFANHYYNNATSSCLLVCPDGTYEDPVTGFCEPCATGCSLCYGSVNTKCTKCATVLTVNYFKEINKDYCTTACATGEYGDTATLLCLACDGACATCTSYTVCQSCQPVSGQAYFLSTSSCISTCPSS